MSSSKSTAISPCFGSSDRPKNGREISATKGLGAIGGPTLQDKASRPVEVFMADCRWGRRTHDHVFGVLHVVDRLDVLRCFVSAIHVLSRLILKTLMLNRTGHWWNRKRLWYYGETVSARTADRPHPITMLIGTVSPLLAVVALVISLQSLRTSHQSVEVGQRAYCSLTDGKMRFAWTNLIFQNRFVASRKLLFSFELHNLGNTPAHVLKVTARVNLPSDWKAASVENTGYHISEKGEVSFSSGDSVGPKGSIIRGYSVDLLRTGETDSSVPDEEIPLQVARYLEGTIDYEDVFLARHSIHWCWIPNEDAKSNIPRSCSDYQLRNGRSVQEEFAQ